MSDSNLTLLPPGSQLGPYRIQGLLGAGGMGQVYRAFDPRLHRDVAIKVARERVGERFDREVRTLAALNHPNICSVYDVGPDYLVMELVEARLCAHASAVRRCPRHAPRRSRVKCWRRWGRRIAPASFIAISNPKTSCFAQTAT